MKHITELVEQGKIKLLISEKIFAFEQIAEAHEYAETGRSTGKIVLTVV